jgi:hypothetical protein
VLTPPLFGVYKVNHQMRSKRDTKRRLKMADQVFQAVKKGAVGSYEYWFAGKMHWEIRKAGQVVAIERDLSGAATKARRLHSLDQMAAQAA